MGNNPTSAADLPLSKEEIGLFIMSVIASSPGFDDMEISPSTSAIPSPSHPMTFSSRQPPISPTGAAQSFSSSIPLSSNLPDHEKTYLKALRIIHLMISRGYRPLNPDEYISEFQSMSMGSNTRPIFIWKPLQVGDDIHAAFALLESLRNPVEHSSQAATYFASSRSEPRGHQSSSRSYVYHTPPYTLLDDSNIYHLNPPSGHYRSAPYDMSMRPSQGIQPLFGNIDENTQDIGTMPFTYDTMAMLGRMAPSYPFSNSNVNNVNRSDNTMIVNDTTGVSGTHQLRLNAVPEQNTNSGGSPLGSSSSSTSQSNQPLISTPKRGRSG